MDRIIRLVVAASALFVSLACGITVDLPVDRIVTGPAQTQPISIDIPAAGAVDLDLNFGAGDLVIKPGQGGKLVWGTATYNVADFKPQVEIQDNLVKLSTGDLEINGIPKLNDKVENKWDLQLSSHPINLKIMAGAYNGNYELGGLALHSLDITDGATKAEVTFSSPNLVEMDRLRYQTGASSVSIFGLANANFKSLIFRSGAGDYYLDFSGNLLRDAVVTIETGLSQVIVAVPARTSAVIIANGGLMDVQADAGWQKEGNKYTSGQGGPSLMITVEMGAGTLILKTID